MRKWSEKERHAIYAAYGKMARDEAISLDEVQLIIEFERERAADEALSGLQAEQIRLEGEQRCKDSAENAAIARETLELMRDKAQNDYEASRERLEFARKRVKK